MAAPTGQGVAVAVKTADQGVVNMTAPSGLGNAEATAFLVNLWTV